MDVVLLDQLRWEPSAVGSTSLGEPGEPREITRGPME